MLNEFRPKRRKNIYLYSQSVEKISDVRTSALFHITCLFHVITSYLNFTKLFTFGKCQYLELSSV